MKWMLRRFKGNGKLKTWSVYLLEKKAYFHWKLKSKSSLSWYICFDSVNKCQDVVSFWEKQRFYHKMFILGYYVEIEVVSTIFNLYDSYHVDFKLFPGILNLKVWNFYGINKDLFKTFKVHKTYKQSRLKLA